MLPAPRLWRAVPPTRILVAALLTLLAALRAGAFIHRQPAGQLDRIDPDRLVRVFGEQKSRASAETNDAMSLILAAQQLTALASDPTRPAALDDSTVAALRRPARSFTGRIFLSMPVLLAQRAAGRPLAETWPLVEPYLTGLDRVDLAHHLPAALQFWQRVYIACGLGPGTAARVTLLRDGLAHNGALPVIVTQLRALQQSLTDAGQTADAELVRRVRLRLLRQWTLDPAPAGLRLLAADLLAEDLALAADATGQPAPPLVLALTEWRRAYHAAADARPVSSFDLARQPTPCPTEERRLVGAVHTLLLLAGILFAAAPIAILTLGPTARHADRTVWWQAVCTSGLILVLTILASRTIDTDYSTARADLRRPLVWTDPASWPVVPQVALAATLIALGGGAILLRFTGRPWRARLGAVALCVWLLHAAVALPWAYHADHRRGQWEQALAAALPDEARALLGPASVHWLEPLRTWEP